jgi:outer membrane lipoprotein-sorting protein
MHPIARLLAAALSLTLLAGAGQPAPRRLHPAYSDDQKADLDRISAYLNQIHTLHSGFIQIGPDGQIDQGELYLEKPGKIRFQYKPPSPVLIVATGGTVYVRNSRLNTVDRYDLSDTPLGLLLNDSVDLKTNQAVTGITRRDDAITVNARTSRNRNDANITLVFAPGPELRQWSVKDNQGGVTTVALNGVEIGGALAPDLFAVPQKNAAKPAK